ncbi:hypothetical protein [Pseudoalteromonas luteoviolacea]|uniref:hypothetical protein n=1 Tax=Pseudoalteromonas luteoviolacea TaxID=43657 RepID=UPI001B38158F|nr:hypothetical protein [Pseudoalteromonas luteoviolacea]MBQ4839792.1 hypothetical protein [Pseudoalteromonas luteoviolacea]
MGVPNHIGCKHSFYVKTSVGLKMNEKELYRDAKKEDWQLYLSWVLLILLGFYQNPLSSMILILIWGIGVARFNKKIEKHLMSIEHDVKELVTKGLTEQEAMSKMGFDKYYYKPFWAVK